MATYFWSSLTDGQIIVFNPAADVLHVDDPAKSAADIFAFVLSTDLSRLTLFDFGLNEDQDKTVTLQVDPRKLTQANITFADGSVLLIGDNAAGTANDDAGNSLVGGIYDDQLLGLGGADSLAGGGGDDYLQGGLGNDTLAGGDGDDILTDIDSSFDSNFQIVGGGDDSLVGGAGGDFFNDIWGNNVLDGGEGADFFLVFALSGGSRATGGPGQDGYILVGNTGLFGPTSFEALDFQAGAGGDLLYIGGLMWLSAERGVYQSGDPFEQGFVRFVQSGADTLVQFDEDGAAGSASTLATQLTLKNVTASGITTDNIVGLITGGSGDDNLVGTAEGDAIFAGDGRDTLDGGAGADSMRGGAGADLYHVDDRDDVVVEIANAQALAAAGIPPDVAAADPGDLADTVIAAVSYSLANVADVENLALAAGSIATAGTGNTLGNSVTGNELNNRLTGLAGNDTLDGGAGIDTAIYSGNLSAFTIGAAGVAVSGPDGTDTLSNIERLQFSNASLAFDLDRGEAAGNTVRLIGAAFGTQFLTPEIIGVVVDIFDAGYTLSELSPVAITVLGSPGDAEFVGMIFRNIVDREPSAEEQAIVIGLLQGSGGPYTQAQILEAAANLEINETHIGLIGMQQNGVEFV